MSRICRRRIQLPQIHFNHLTEEFTMNRLKQTLLSLFFALILLSIFSCAGGPRGKMPRIESPTESELKQDWANYTVYFRHKIAFIYKLKDNRKIILDNKWVPVTTSEMMAKSKILDSTWVRKILGPNGEMYGYLVHRSADTANVKIIDENTVQLYYHYVRTSGGP
jgi:hypothetical protein